MPSMSPTALLCCGGQRRDRAEQVQRQARNSIRNGDRSGCWSLVSWRPQPFLGLGSHNPVKNHPRGVLGQCLHQRSCHCQPLALLDMAGQSLAGSARAVQAVAMKHVV